jgi:ribose-phosphate pyrophosphokinase
VAEAQYEGLIARLSKGERVPSAPPMLFAGRSHPELSAKIGMHLGIELGGITIEDFSNGETYCRFDESVRGADVFLIQSCAGRHTNDYLFELLEMVNAAKLASAKRITAVMPWFPYSRQDKKSAPREPITARLVADLLAASGIDRGLAMDLHAGQIQGFFSLPFDHMTAIPTFVEYLRDDKGLSGEGIVVVSPDAGRVKVARRFAKRLECDLAVLNKDRPGHDQSTVSHLIGDVDGKIAIMTDDIISTGGTLAAGASALKEAGAREVYACATHGLFPPGALEKLAESDFEEIIVTDTVPAPEDSEFCDKLRFLSVSQILAESIANVWAGESVSDIFAGENNLF